MDSTWVPHGIHWIPYGMQAYPTLDSMEQIQFHGISAGIPREQAYLITKNSGNIKNQTPASTKYHVIGEMNTLSAALCNRLKVRM